MYELIRGIDAETAGLQWRRLIACVLRRWIIFQYCIAKYQHPQTQDIVSHNPRHFFILFVFKYIADFGN